MTFICLEKLLKIVYYIIVSILYIFACVSCFLYVSVSAVFGGSSRNVIGGT